MTDMPVAPARERLESLVQACNGLEAIVDTLVSTVNYTIAATAGSPEWLQKEVMISLQETRESIDRTLDYFSMCYRELVLEAKI